MPAKRLCSAATAGPRSPASPGRTADRAFLFRAAEYISRSRTGIHRVSPDLPAMILPRRRVRAAPLLRCIRAADMFGDKAIPA